MDPMPSPPTTTITHDIPAMQPDAKTCPYCAELIQSAAIRCRHCGADLIRGKTSASLVIALIFFCVLTAVSFARTAILWAAFANASGKLALLLWHSLLSFGMVGILIGAWKRSNWGRDWLSGTATLQALTLGYAVIVGLKSADDNAMWVVAMMGLGSLAALVSRIAIHSAKGDFVPPQSELRNKSYDTVITVALLLLSFVVDLLSPDKPVAESTAAQETVVSVVGPRHALWLEHAQQELKIDKQTLMAKIEDGARRCGVHVDVFLDRIRAAERRTYDLQSALTGIPEICDYQRNNP